MRLKRLELKENTRQSKLRLMRTILGAYLPKDPMRSRASLKDLLVGRVLTKDLLVSIVLPKDRLINKAPPKDPLVSKASL